jgi:hypothetical protein
MLYPNRFEALAWQLQSSCVDIFHFKNPGVGRRRIDWLNDSKQNDADICESIWKQGVDCNPVSVTGDRKNLTLPVVCLV